MIPTIPAQAYNSKIQIRFNDIDALGHVNNAIQITYLEVARVAYFKHLMKINWNTEGIILAKVIIDYKQPILLYDDITVKIWCSKVGTKSFDLAYALVKQKQTKDVILATATTIQVCYNYEQNKTIVIPQTWRDKLTDNLYAGFDNN